MLWTVHHLNTQGAPFIVEAEDQNEALTKLGQHFQKQGFETNLGLHAGFVSIKNKDGMLVMLCVASATLIK
ncbi:hypothetical protein KJZ63_00820 [Patescibacteria group bacterium]|nr:hypothetical protein [Patescibacteria group bacterium]